MQFRSEQSPSDIVDVSGWVPDQDFPIFPQGSRPKRALIAPKENLLPFLVAEHRYMLKYSVPRHPAQYWSEVIAYELGRILDVQVPPCFAAIEQGSGRDGALIEFFYGWPGAPVQRYVSGQEYLKRIIPNFDVKKGRQHNVRTNMSVSLALPGMSKSGKAVEFWSKTFVFDALIGNTDRHQENWGVLWDFAQAEVLVEFAPAFDNGTSLAYELIEEKLEQYAPQWIEAYVRRGRHHVKWSVTDTEKMGHMELCVRFAETYPRARYRMLQALHFDFSRVEHVLSWATRFDAPNKFTPRRADFLSRLIGTRRQSLLEALDK